VFFETAGLREAVHAIVRVLESPVWQCACGDRLKRRRLHGDELGFAHRDLRQIVGQLSSFSCSTGSSAPASSPPSWFDTELSITFASFGWLSEPLLAR